MKKISWIKLLSVFVVACILASTNVYAVDKGDISTSSIDTGDPENYGYCIIPDGTKTIPDGRYTETDFDVLVLNDGLESIGSGAFVNDLPFFKDVYIPASVKTIGDKAIGYDSEGRKAPYFSVIYGQRGTAAESYAKANGFKFVEVNYDNSTGESILTINESVSRSFTFGKTFDKAIVNPGAEIGADSFLFSVLKNVVFNDYGTGEKITLYGSAFSNTEIETLYVPSNVVFKMDIDHNYGGQFSRCDYLKTVYIATEVTEQMFSGCASLKEVYFTPDNNAKYVDDRAFSHCISLEKVDFSRSSKSSLTFGYYVFEKCSNLKEMILDSDTKFYSSLYDCTNLEKIIVYGRPDITLADFGSSRSTVYISKRFMPPEDKFPSSYYPMTPTPMYTISKVEYTPTDSSVNDYSFYVDGRALKIQVIEESGATRTFSRYAGNVSIKSYDEDNKEVGNLSSNVDYEIWTVHTRLTPDSNLQVRSKYDMEWSEYKYKFSVTTLYSDQTLKSASISSNDENPKLANCSIVTGSGVNKVRIEYEDGMTTTVNFSAAVFNSVYLTYTYNITVKPRHSGKNTFKIYTKTPTDGWKYQTTLNYTVN